ncbi:WD40 repeat 2 [Fusarium heterosporum]|uniref:WD40 repeat 2 n=1 Tax=Fusarium heterosporum TaxID=42747 RepID=A0A8H5WFA5_FUSHE|nr:WD40 repeat 2 [Fusarium heterosporum]
MSDPPVKLPGFGIPLSFLPDDKCHFPMVLGIDSDFKANTLTNRELCMLRFMEEITNKPDWWIKVHDEFITTRWKAEVLKIDWHYYLKHGDFTPTMADATLEDIPDEAKDWHPGSNGTVLNLVHPSLCPLVYGESRIVSDRLISVTEALGYCGKGKVIQRPSKKEIKGEFWHSRPTLDDEPRRSSYAEGYSDSEAFDSGTDSDPDLRERHVPRLWRAPKMKINTVLRNITQDTDFSESEYESEEYNSAEDEVISDWDSEEMSEDEEVERDPSHVSEDEVKRRDLKWFSKTHPLLMPEPSAEWYPKIRAEDVRERDFFKGILPETGTRRLQVIVKLANIHLTPDTPTYPGGSWHIEGQINEHICATALFYYDNENITDSFLDFRTRSNGDGLNEGNLKYAQNDRKSIQRVFAIEENHSTIQSVGSVLTKEGRALFFPNVFQHHLGSFKLADPTRPGHRKILALFLVDPAIPVISTSNVPPQQKDWWPEELVTNSSCFGLPFDTEKSREYRKELMQERSANEWSVIDKMKHVEWNFCEH